MRLGSRKERRQVCTFLLWDGRSLNDAFEFHDPVALGKCMNVKQIWNIETGCIWWKNTLLCPLFTLLMKVVQVDKLLTSEMIISIG